MSAHRVVFSGAKGRMGRALLPGLRAEPDVEVVGEVDLGDDLGAAVAAGAATIVVDFTTPQAAVPNAHAILGAGAHGVIGTTGFTAADLAALDRAARERQRGLLVAPNFSIGMILLQRFAEEAARHLRRVEITETHHEGKLDAPSGTARDTAERIAAAGALPGPAGPAARGLDVGGVRIHSRRLPGIHASQEVHLAGPNESLTLHHAALSRDCYLAGVVAAIRAVSGRLGLTHGLGAIL